jgi:predicted kinase
MTDIEGGLSPEVLDKPLLIFKIGVLGCAPLDMPSTLAEEYGAQFFSSDLIRKELMDARDAEGGRPARPQDIDVKQIRRVLEERATPMLSEGEDVVVDMFFNTRKSRQHVLNLARNTGALTLALWINTPFSLGRKRVKQWAEQGSFSVPVDRWARSPMAVVRSMINDIEPPTQEGIDFIFNLHGMADTVGMLHQFDDKLEQSGLAARYED